ncbi:hypothetical protein ACF8Q9_08215 [Pseudomonas sp. TYF_15]|uniref:hypothetical protein n=1 Tax=Pseudomonas sp. TYF_15 TaxID=3367194 RepID=UPI00370B907C
MSQPEPAPAATIGAPPPLHANDSASPQQAEYNIVYEQLVEGEDDIVGQLAYCLYKQSKQQYLKAFESRNDRRPTDAELRNHVDCAEIPALGMYRDKATRMVEELLAQAAQEQQDELEGHFKDRLWEFILRHQHESFGERSWHAFKSLLFGGLGGVVGNFLTTVVVLLFLFWAASSATRDEFSKSAKESLVSGLAEIIGVGVTINATSKPALPATPAATQAQ